MLAEEKRKGNQHEGASLPLWGASQSGRPAPVARTASGRGGESTLGEKRMGCLGAAIGGMQGAFAAVVVALQVPAPTQVRADGARTLWEASASNPAEEHHSDLSRPLQRLAR